jgi:16S rRNA (guanine527-N7)-methyltransferase
MVDLAGGQEAFLAGMRRLGVDVSRETAAQLKALVATLQRWQKAINLVGRGSLADVWVRHVLDSAQLQPLIPPAARRLTDLGSGAGFPGLVLAALRPDLEVTLIEADARKAAFLAEAARHMGLSRSPRVLAGRIESIPASPADVLTARALAPLRQLLDWADRHRTDTAICLFHKGKDWQVELTEAMKDWEIPYESFTSVTNRDAVILRLGPYKSAGLRHRQPKGRRGQDDHGD